MTTSSGYITEARIEKAKSLVRALYSDLALESTPLEAATLTRDASRHTLWWTAVAKAADVNYPSQQTVDKVIELIEFVEEIKEIESARRSAG